MAEDPQIKQTGDELPPAWYGSVDAEIGKIALICSYCINRKEAEDAARAKGFYLSHGICPACYPAALAEAQNFSQASSPTQ